MGINKEISSRRNKKPSSGGSIYAKVRPEQAKPMVLRWPNADALAVVECINAVLAAGHAISFARSRSGRTLSVVILAGDDRPRWTADDEDEAAELLREVAQAAFDATGEDAL